MANAMKIANWVIATLMFLSLTLVANADDACRYMKERSALSGYDTGGPYKLDHFKLTKGRMDLRDFLWNHWHKRIRGVAEAKVGTVDAGTVTALYVVQPDMHGHWGIDVELGRPLQPPPCSAFRADSLVRVPIDKPDDDNYQTLLSLPDGKVPPEARLPDSETKGAKFYKIVLMENQRAIGDDI
jgi:hypothetical protein